MNHDQTLQALDHAATFPSLIELRITGEDEPELSEDIMASFVASPLYRRLISFEIGAEKFDRLPRPEPFSIIDSKFRGPYRLR